LCHFESLFIVRQRQNMSDCEGKKRSVEEGCSMCGLEDCMCDDDDVPRETSFFYSDTGNLAPRPDGKCYCGKQRTLCGNFKRYDVDCNSFVKNAHLGCHYNLY
jgi:hypothetical protein